MRNPRPLLAGKRGAGEAARVYAACGIAGGAAGGPRAGRLGLPRRRGFVRTPPAREAAGSGPTARISSPAMKILTCNSNRPLAEAISAYLGLPLTQASVRRFSDMEVFVEIHENVRGEDVFVIQSTSYPANDHLMELLVTLDALKRGSARRVTAVIPYYGYARQDRKSGAAHADLGQARRQSDHRRRRRPGADARSPCRPDPGLLRHPDRQSLSPRRCS